MIFEFYRARLLVVCINKKINRHNLGENDYFQASASKDLVDQIEKIIGDLEQATINDAAKNPAYENCSWMKSISKFRESLIRVWPINLGI